ncbi:MAG: uroporphyrinogen decarboxylase family protein, partial [Syntrophomonadaceae bacterium]|nr:uroporphyrinogen decarboxylase family protein [Syntrophomonadaceae bacterium]
RTDLLYLGSPDEVIEGCRQIIEKMKYHPGGFILMPACSMPALAPPVNVHAMVKAARLFGKYDN